MRLPFFVLTALLILPEFALPQMPEEMDFPNPPMGETINENRFLIKPGVNFIHRETNDPMHLYILLVDLENPSVQLKTALAQDSVINTETVLSMATRHGALAAINGDYWGPEGVPQGLTVVDGEIVIAPKFRTAFAVTNDGEAVIDNWNDGWGWKSEVLAENGQRHGIVMMNSDCNPGWLCMYTEKWGRSTPGNTFSPVVEVFVDGDQRVIDIRQDLPGEQVPKNGYVLTGRDAAGDWLLENISPGDELKLDLKSSKPLNNLQTAICAGPRIMKDGEYVQDPLALFPEGEEFSLEWKKMHYLERHPRSGLGVSKDGKTLILATVDGRQEERSVGIYQRQMAEILKEFGAWNAMDLDSGGSATMVIGGQIINNPSDKVKPDGTGGQERKVANALLILYDD